MKSWLVSVLHNCFVHPLLPFLPHKLGQRLHDWSASLWDK